MPPALRPYNTSETPQHEVFHSCIGNQGTDLQLLWLSWLRFIPTRDLLAAVGHHPHPPKSPAVSQACRGAGLWELQPCWHLKQEGSFPAFSCKPKVRSTGFGTGRHKATGTGAGGSRAGRQTQGWGRPKGLG